MVGCTPYTALTRYLRSLDADVHTRSLTFGELHAALGQRLPMGAEIASAWQDENCALARAVAAAGFKADLQSTERGWVVTFTRRTEAATRRAAF
jgi:hypothetical protein